MCATPYSPISPHPSTFTIPPHPPISDFPRIRRFSIPRFRRTLRIHLFPNYSHSPISAFPAFAAFPVMLRFPLSPHSTKPPHPQISYSPSFADFSAIADSPIFAKLSRFADFRFPYTPRILRVHQFSILPHSPNCLRPSISEFPVFFDFPASVGFRVACIRRSPRIHQF